MASCSTAPPAATLLCAWPARRSEAGLQPLGDCWALDTEALSWRELALERDAPSARNAAVGSRLADGRLAVHGGWWPFKESYNDTHLLELQG